MNQTKATGLVAEALNEAEGYGFDHVAILTSVDDEQPCILIQCDGAHLSVTVQVLAQP